MLIVYLPELPVFNDRLLGNADIPKSGVAEAVVV